MTKHYKWQKTRWIALLIVIVSLFLLSCKTLKLPVDIFDKEVCGDLGPAGAHCNHTLTEQPRDLNLEDWDKLRYEQGWLCMHPDAFADTEASLEEVCRRVECDYKTKDLLKKLKKQVNSINKIVKESKENRQ